MKNNRSLSHVRILLLLCIGLFVTVALMTGCTDTADTPPADTTPAYSWIAGESPVPLRRSGLAYQGRPFGCDTFECAENGFYMLTNVSSNRAHGRLLLYADYESDILTPLCFRPDCEHNTIECDAFFRNANGICYENGYLYIDRCANISMSSTEVIRMNPDGTDRTVVMSLKDSQLHLGGMAYWTLWNGIYSFSDIHMNQGKEIWTGYYYRWDGSMDTIAPSNGNLGGGVNHGDAFLMRWDIIFQWDPDTVEITELSPDFGYGYYTTEEGYYMTGNKFCRHTYEEEEPVILFDTGLEGDDFWVTCFPDCLAIYPHYENGQVPESVPIYFYNWNFEFLGKTDLDFFHSSYFQYFIYGETPNRIVFINHSFPTMAYYVEKSDFASGLDSIPWHPYEFPDPVFPREILPGQTILP